MLPVTPTGNNGCSHTHEMNIYDVLSKDILGCPSQTYGIRTRTYYLDRVAL